MTQATPWYSVTSIVRRIGARSALAIALVAALAVGVLVFSTAQPAGAQSAETIEYKENGTGPVATFISQDPDKDDEATWDLTGVDAGELDIKDGVLTFKEAPDFEAARDSDEDNTYEVTVTATDAGKDGDKETAEFKVEVKVINLDEKSEVTWTVDHDGDGRADTPTLMQFQAGAFLEASVTDGDVPSSDKDVSLATNISWQWRRSPDKTAMGTAIDGADDPFYTVTAADVGQHIRVEATYILSGQTAETAYLTSDYPVLAEAASDAAAPRFAQANITRKVDEGKKGRMVGDPVTATGGHGVLNYELTGNDSDRFDIDQKTGQITTEVDLDHEAAAAAGDNCVAQNKCVVEVTAWDAAGTDSDPVATVTISIGDVDEKPMFTGGDNTVEVEENHPKDVAINAVAYEATDPEGDRVNYSLRGSDAREFDIDADGFLTFNTKPDYEMPRDRGRDNTYEITVRAMAVGSSLYADKAVKVNVTNEEEPPEIGGDDIITIEKYEEGREDAVTTLKAKDPEGGKITWSLVDADGTAPPDIPNTITIATDAADDEDLTINEDTGVLTFGSPPDFEAPVDSDTDNVYMVVVVATDTTEGTALNSYKKVVVTVTNKAETGKVSFVVGTDMQAQFSVGQTVTASVTDGDETAAGQVPGGIAPTYQWYRLPSKNARGTAIADPEGTAAAYAVIADDLDQYLKVVASYRVTADGSEAATATNPLETATLTSDYPVKAANPATAEEGHVEPPAFAADIERTVKEGEKGQKAGAPVTATGGHGELYYEKGTTGADNDKFEINSKTGQITTSAELDLEATAAADNCIDNDDECEVDIIARDAAGQVSSAATVTITITDVNEKPTFDGSPPAKMSVEENQTKVTDDDAFQASDPEGRGVTLTLKTGADSGLFRLTDDEALYFKAKPDYEDPKDRGRDNIYEVTVQASDGRLRAEHTISVTVTNVNEKPEIVKVGVSLDGPASVMHEENSDAAIGTYKASETSATLSLTGDDAADFMLEGTGYSRMLKFMSAPDYEDPMDADTDNTYEVTVKAMYMAYGQPYTDEQMVMVTVTNVDEAPMITGGDAAVTYAENGTDPVATYMATDPEGETVTLSLSGADMEDFNFSEGVLSFKTAPDFEAPADADMDNMYMITVTATDGTTDPAEMAVTVTVTDVDENQAPMFDGETATREVPENSAAGANVGDPVTATDAGDTLTYMLSGDDAMYFAIDNMGQITVGADAMLDYEMKMSYMVTVTATDTGSKMDTINVTIMVTNVDEAGMVSLSSMSPEVGTAVTATLTDPDGGVTGETWQWSKSMTMDGKFMDIDGATSMSYMPVAGDAGYHLRATASYTDAEGSGKSAMAATTGMVIAVDDNPGTLTLSTDEPMVGTAVTATLTDADEVVAESEVWYWSKSMAMGGTFDRIEETRGSYTPTAEDVGYYLRATVEYDDGHGTGKRLTATAEKPVPDPLVVRYDDNGDRMVQKGEVIKAINDYLFNDTLTKAEVIKLINLYLFGRGDS